MRTNPQSISCYLRYWFIPNFQPVTNVFTDHNSLLDDTRNEIDNIILSRFINAAKKIKDLSEKTNKKIFLALSWWIDSALIYKIFCENWINFSAVNIEYSWHYSEVNEVSSFVSSNDKVQFVKKRFNPTIHKPILEEIAYPNIVSHPTIFAYKDITESIPKNCLLVTGDLWDEIFWDTCWDLIPNKPIPEYIFNKEELDKIFSFKMNHEEIITNDNSIVTEIFVIYNLITYNMWYNVTKTKNIQYVPFYKYFLDLVPYIKANNLASNWKDYLHKFWNNFWLSLNHKKIWIKFPVNQSVNEYYLTYLKSRWHILESKGLNINFNYLEDNINNWDPKNNKWKLFSLILFTIYLEKNDIRFLKS